MISEKYLPYLSVLIDCILDDPYEYALEYNILISSITHLRCSSMLLLWHDRQKHFFEGNNAAEVISDEFGTFNLFDHIIRLFFILLF